MEHATKFASFDIDGILNDYPRCWLKYIESVCGTYYKDTSAAKIALAGKYESLKDEYRASEYKYTLPINPDAIELINACAKNKFKIVYATSRPLINAKYPLMAEKTINWIKSSGLQIDQLVYKDVSCSWLDTFNCQIQFHVDDELRYAEEISKRNIPVYLINDQAVVNHDKILICKNIKYLLNIKPWIN